MMCGWNGKNLEQKSSLDQYITTGLRTWYQIKIFRERVQTKNDTQLLGNPNMGEQMTGG